LIYGVVAGTLLRRTAGTGWGAIPMPGCPVVSIVPSPVYPGHVRIGIRPGSSTSSCSLLLDSTDGGRTFAPTASPVSDGGGAAVAALASDPVDPHTQYVAIAVYSSPTGPTGQLLYATTDDARSWRSLDWDPTLSVHQLALSPDGRRLYAVSDSGIFARELRL